MPRGAAGDGPAVVVTSPQPQQPQHPPAVADLAGVARCSGWLCKQGGTVKNWKMRWCVLDADTLFYFITPQADKPKGAIPIAGSGYVLLSLSLSLQSRHTHTHCYTVTTCRTPTKFMHTSILTLPKFMHHKHMYTILCALTRTHRACLCFHTHAHQVCRGGSSNVQKADEAVCVQALPPILA